MKLIEDLKTINNLDDDQFAAFLTNINSNELLSFKGLSDFEAFCTLKNIKFDDAKTIVRVLNFVFDLVIQKRDVSTALIYFENTFIEPAKKDLDVLRAWTRIKDNINNLPSFYLFRKRYKLRNILPGLGEFNVICDARPIYDSAKTIIDYLFPMILKIKTDDDEDLICEIDEEDLSAIETEIAYAKLKLSNLRSTLKGNSQKGNPNG
ncbi:MAG: hypothetical protein NTW38_12215 [Candidatus Aminicenantes bacterium]|nr:hypothetical protein [Candidatus Aminicenantes bacterium]